MENYIEMTYFQLQALWSAKSKHRKKDSYKLENNTYIYKDGDAFLIKLHNTFIIISNIDSLTLNSGGWDTFTTRDRVNGYIKGLHIFHNSFSFGPRFKHEWEGTYTKLTPFELKREDLHIKLKPYTLSRKDDDYYQYTRTIYLVTENDKELGLVEKWGTYGPIKSKRLAKELQNEIFNEAKQSVLKEG